MSVLIKWDTLKLRCGCCREHDLQLEVRDSGIFYICPGDRCYNEMNSQLYDKMIDIISEHLAKEPDMNLTGLSWKIRNSYQQLDYQVIEHMQHQVTIQVANLKKCPSRKKGC